MLIWLIGVCAFAATISFWVIKNSIAVGIAGISAGYWLEWQLAHEYMGNPLDASYNSNIILLVVIAVVTTAIIGILAHVFGGRSNSKSDRHTPKG